MTDHSHNDHHDSNSFAHPVPVKLLLGIFFSLVFLTGLTIAVNELPLGKLDIWVALGIASVKGMLVLLFFMHVYWEKGFNIIAFGSSVLFLALFIGLALLDTGQNLDTVNEYPRASRPDLPVTWTAESK